MQVLQVTPLQAHRLSHDAVALRDKNLPISIINVTFYSLCPINHIEKTAGSSLSISRNKEVAVLINMSKPGSDHVAVEIEETEESESVFVSIKHFDEDLVHRAIRDAGRWAYGTVVVEIWVLNKEKTALFHPDGG